MASQLTGVNGQRCLPLPKGLCAPLPFPSAFPLPRLALVTLPPPCCFLSMPDMLPPQALCPRCPSVGLLVPSSPSCAVFFAVLGTVWLGSSDCFNSWVSSSLSTPFPDLFFSGVYWYFYCLFSHSERSLIHAGSHVCFGRRWISSCRPGPLIMDNKYL